MTAHIPPDRELPNQEAVDLVMALQRCLANFHGRQDEPAVLPVADEASLARLGRYLDARQMRHMIFGEGLFADPVWDMLLLLYQAELEHRPMTFDGVCEVSGVSRSAALRHIGAMERRGLLLPRQDPDTPGAHLNGGYRLRIRLSPLAIDAMTSWLRLTLAPDDADDG
jgi:hypothetical protein